LFQNDLCTGASFDLRPLTLTSQQDPNPYSIVADEQGTNFTFAWNFCDEIPVSVLPEPCQLMGKSGAIVQAAHNSDTDYYCFILAHFNAHSDQPQVSYRLIDASDPAQGLLLSYPVGDRCSVGSGAKRSAVIEVQCAEDVDQEVVSLREEDQCQYHIVMKSRYGCPMVGDFMFQVVLYVNSHMYFIS